MHKHFLTLLLILGSLIHSAQNPITDSLKKIAIKVDADSASKLYIKIAYVFTGVNSDSVRFYASKAAMVAPERSSQKGDVLIQFGNSYHMESKIDSALSYYNKALQYFEKIKNEKGIAKAYQSFALIKRSLNDHKGSLQDSEKALEVYERINWTLGKVNVLHNMSNSSMLLQNYDDAVKYARRALSLSKTLNDSLKYFQMMSEYGGKLFYVDKIDSSVYYIQKAEPFFERNQMYAQLIVLHSNLADAFWNLKKNIKLCKSHLFRSLKYTDLSGARDNSVILYRELTNCYIAEKRSDSASFYLNKAFALSDSLNAANAIRSLNEMQTKYETEKKEERIKNQAFEIGVKEKENKQKSQVILVGSLALIVTVIFGLLAFVNFKRAKKANIIIEHQKKEVEQKNHVITQQKNLVEEKQKEILDSITYAKRIQQAVLTGEDVWSNVSKDHFILFKPKDIVSGDFYWAYNTNNGYSIFTLADCTGHGVPGGFMSMLGNSFLNEIVVENGIVSSSEILNRLRDKIISALEQKGDIKQKDGMDMALCVWNKKDNILEFSGANNPIWIVRNFELSEYKADKMPIGSYLDENKPFSSVKIQLQKDDVIYLSTDGYADQFGGPKGKKLKYKMLMESLLQNKHESMKRQRELLDSKFEDWRSSFDQVDDVSVIGIRV